MLLKTGIISRHFKALQMFADKVLMAQQSVDRASIVDFVEVRVVFNLLTPSVGHQEDVSKPAAHVR